MNGIGGIIPGLVLLVSLLPGCREKEAASDAPPLSVSSILADAAPRGFARAVAPRTFVFPGDHGAHPEFRTEWWYFTGNLNSPDGHRFGYQLTFFRNALVPHAVRRDSAWGGRDVYMAHFAVTDIDGNAFRASERFGRGALGIAGAGGSPFRVHLEDWEARETGQNPWGMHLAAKEGGLDLELDVRAVKLPVLNGERGLSRKGRSAGNASYYYSVPRLATDGTIRIDGRTFRVSGLSWFDREWSTSALEPDQAGWDWFALQLHDGRDLMIYRLRRRDGSTDPFSGGTVVAADGSYRTLPAGSITIEERDFWRSPESGIRYPARWRVTVAEEGLDLDVVPSVAGQELAVSFRYWEGAVLVRTTGGGPAGAGYAELAGYGDPRGENRVVR